MSFALQVCEEDTVPNVICDICCAKLRKGYEFKSMCVKNHIALRDYAKQLLKYMENPTSSPYFFNVKKKPEPEPERAYESDRSDCSDDSSDNRLYIKEEDDSEPEASDKNDEPLALVKADRKEGDSSSYVPEAKRVKVEAEEYAGEDLRKKAEAGGLSAQREFAAGYPNVTNEMVMKYLKLEFAEKEEAGRPSNGAEPTV